MKNLLRIAVASSLLAIGTGANNTTAEPSMEDAVTAISTAEQALDRALGFTGFERADYVSRSDPSKMATKVVVEDDKTPFFHDRIVNKELWVVTFDSVYVEIPGLAKSWERTQVRKTYDLYIEPESGCLLKVESRWNGYDSTLSEEPPAGVATSEMLKDGVAYLDVVKVLPEIDFYHALQVATECYPANSRQIVAHLVISDRGGADPRPVWSILGRGTPPFEHFGPPGAVVPEWQRNRRRTLVDATNGDHLGWMINIPPVDPPEGWSVDSDDTGH